MNYEQIHVKPRQVPERQSTAPKGRLYCYLVLLVALFLVSLAAAQGSPAAALSGVTYTYTLDADFGDGTLINVNYADVPDQLQLNSKGEAFNFIWVAASNRGTIIKIDTQTGAILGEYRSAPDGMGRNPSRTTVDANGNVWAGNRNEASGGRGSVVHVGLVENGQCVDRNGNNTIDTSTGLGDIRPWTNAGGADTNGGVSTAEDECIVHYVRTSGTNVRTVAVDASNNVWIGGYGNRVHELYDSSGAAVPGTQFNLGCGGYGGLLDANGVLWSASLINSVLRYDTVSGTGSCIALGAPSYGLGIDTDGNIWHTNWTANTIKKISPAGVIQGTFNTGGASGDRGVAVRATDNSVWVANSGGNNVSRLNSSGAFQTLVTVGNSPTGVAVDAAGKVWVTNLGSDSAMRIDPATNLVDLTVDLGAGAGPYNYSDMTGSTLIAPPSSGTWLVTHDSTIDLAPWSSITWNAATPSDSDITVRVRTSNDNATWSAWFVAGNGGVPTGLPNGRYMQIEVSFTRATTGETPILYDLTVAANRPPVADANGPYTVDEGSSVSLDGTGSYDPDGNPLTYEWDLDNDGVFETTGTSPQFFGPDGPAAHPVSLRVCDPYGLCDVDSSTVEVLNVPPTAEAGANQTVYRNETVFLNGSWTDPAEGLDNLYLWNWDLDGDGLVDLSGSESYGNTVPASATFSLEGFYTLTFDVTDKDGGFDDDTVVIEVLNKPPDCSVVSPSASVLWPPNHQFVAIDVLGVTDPEGDIVTITIDSIFQDEPVDTVGDGRFTPDGRGVGTSTAEVRAERTGTPAVPGNGRVYHIGFTADDGHGGTCSNTVLVSVPHDVKDVAIDDGPLYDSTVP